MIWLAAAAVIALTPPPPPPPAPKPPAAAAAGAEEPSTTDTPTPYPLYDGSPGSSVEAAYGAAEAHQGRLDGHWRLSDGLGDPLFDFMLADRGAAPAPPEDPAQPPIDGAWRDLQRRGALDDAGVLDRVRREGTRLRLEFTQPGAAAPLTLTLDLAPAGDWIGDLRLGGRDVTVFLERL
jgi:hypothetical protein